jgi:hypothetical protein
MKKTLRPNMPKEHPKPFQSQLWPHLETIRQMRRERKMWTEIADHLKTKGVTVSYRTVRNFFLRTRSPKRRIPAGFEEALGVVPKQPATVPAGPAQPAASVRSQPKPSAPPGADDDLLEPVVEETVSERKVRELREKRQKNPPTK